MDFLFGYYEAILVEEAHIQDKTFKVTIPALFAARDSRNEGEEQIVHNLQGGNLVNSKAFKNSPTVTGTTIFEAKNHTDYTFQLKGDVYEMEGGSKGRTLSNLKDSGGIVIVPGRNTPHYHKWEDKHEMYNMIFENLNNVKLPKGTKCYGFFINGENNVNSFAITRIEGAIPLSSSDAPKYEKNGRETRR